MLRHIGFVFAITLALFAFKSRPHWLTYEWSEDLALAFTSPPANFELSTRQRLDQLTVEIRPQVYRGVPIEDAFLKILSRNSKIVWARARYIDVQSLPDLKTDPLDKEKLSRIVTTSEAMQARLGCKFKTLPPEPLWRHKTWRWRVIYRRACEFPSGEIENFAFNSRGEVIDRQIAGIAFSWQNRVLSLYPKGPRHSELTKVGVPLSNEPGFFQTPVIDATSDGGFAFLNQEQLSNLNPNDERFDLAQAYYFAINAIQWVYKEFAIRPQQIKLRTHVGFPERTNAAFYFKGEVRLGSGDGEHFDHIAQDPSIVTHEVMHGILDRITGLPFSGEGGSLNEAIADSLTALSLQTAKMGETAFLKGSFQRNLEEKIPFQKRHGSVYGDSLVLSSLIWEFHQEMGEESAKELVVQLMSYLAPDSDFKTARSIVRNWAASCMSGERCQRANHILSQRGWL